MGPWTVDQPSRRGPARSAEMVDVVLDGYDEPDVPSGAAAAGGADGSRSGSPAADGSGGAVGTRGGRRRGRLLTAGVVVLVAVVGVTANLVEAELAERRDLALATMPGAVAPISGPLERQWELPGAAWLAATDGLLVLWQGGANPVLEGRDLQTGAARWSVAATAAGLARCDGAGEGPRGPVVVCWHDDSSAVPPTGAYEDEAPLPGHLVLVDGDDGSVLARHPIAVPDVGTGIVGGDLVTASRSGTQIVVQRVDLVDGTLVWSSAVEVGEPLVPGAPMAWLMAEHEVVVVQGQATAVLAAGDGTVLHSWAPHPDDDVGVFGGEPATEVVITADGFGAWPGLHDGVRSQRGTWYDNTGAVVSPVSGFLVEPWITDGSVPDILLTARDDRQRLAGTDLDTGRLRWSVPATGGRVLMRRDGAVVVGDGRGVAAYDLRTGESRWSTPVQGLRPDLGALTDGHTLVLVVLRRGHFTLQAVDLEQGRLRWEQEAPGPGASQDLILMPGSDAPHLMSLDGQAVLRRGRVLVGVG